MEQLLNEHQTAQRLNVSVQLLRKWRAKQEGPKFVKLGKCVRYVASDIDYFIQSRRTATGKEAPTVAASIQ